ncbi:MAG TPA: metallophosphoesterase, partial [Candidatus Acidoferrales bacterium]|nr:metallophosphoesterase [Candidatus Acidoferrales bacterium]
MGNTVIFPVPGSSSAGEKLNRWLGRWRQGGIEHYSSESAQKPRPVWRSGERFFVNQERIWLDTLPSSFHGLRIVQISDIHHGLFLPKEWLSDAVKKANRLNPDIIALTGDYVTYSR